MNLNRLIFINVCFAVATGLVLIIAPGLISDVVHIKPDQNLVYYLRGTSEPGLAALVITA
jgi:hypothetical protein